LRAFSFLSSILLLSLASIGVVAEDQQQLEPFTVEYYYKITWGYYDEWLALYKKNHWPVLLAEMKSGYIVDVQVHEPQNYGAESHRWDVRITITFKNVLVPHGATDRSARRQQLIERLHPDRKDYEREEQRRWQLVESFWDTELIDVATDQWPET
jgi:hypothetical protein